MNRPAAISKERLAELIAAMDKSGSSQEWNSLRRQLPKGIPAPAFRWADDNEPKSPREDF